MLAPLYLATAFAFGSPQLGPSQAATCLAPQNPPIIRVDVNVAQPGIDHTVARANLKQFEITTVSPYGANADVHVNGLMRGAITVETHMSLAWQRTADETVNCSWYDNVTLVMKLNPTIYIARDIPDQSCLYREVLNHEYRHYQMDFNIIKDYQIIFRQELERFAQQAGVTGPYSKEQQESVKRDQMERLEKTIEEINERMKIERIKRQATIDTRSEYESVASKCR